MRCYWPGPPPPTSREAEHTSISRNSTTPRPPHTDTEDTRDPPPNVRARFAGVRARHLAYAPPLNRLHEDGRVAYANEQNHTAAGGREMEGKARAHLRPTLRFCFPLRTGRGNVANTTAAQYISLYTYTRDEKIPLSFHSFFVNAPSPPSRKLHRALAKPVQPHATHPSTRNQHYIHIPSTSVRATALTMTTFVRTEFCESTPLAATSSSS